MKSKALSMSTAISRQCTTWRRRPGMHSLVLGEAQIQGQVRRALGYAIAAGAAGPELRRLFESAISAGRQVPSRTGLARGAASVSHASIGTMAGRLVWGIPAARTPVVDAALHPGSGWTFWDHFPAEAATVAAIVVAVDLFLSVPRLAGAVPYLVGFLMGAAIAGLGSITGGSANPARQFGPAIVSGRTHLLSAYILAPLLGAVIAPAITDLLRTRSLSTHALCGPSAHLELPSARHDR
jgi:hypothetical protein